MCEEESHSFAYPKSLFLRINGARSVHRYTAKQNQAEPIFTQVEAIVFWK